MADITVSVRALSRPSTQIKARILGLEADMRQLLGEKSRALANDMRTYAPPRPDSTYVDRKGKTRTRRAYQRTYKLREHWHADPVQTTGGALIAQVNNDVTDRRGRPYASFVQGPLTGAHRQVPYFGAIGWLSITTAHARRGQELAQEVRRLLREALALT